LLTFRISKRKERRKSAPVDETVLENILASTLRRSIFRVGDTVKFKKPRNNPMIGKIVSIQEKVSEVTWVNGSKYPMNIVVDVIKYDKKTGLEYGTMRVKTNAKKITFYGGSQ
jgi:hypothetical protein